MKMKRREIVVKKDEWSACIERIGGGYALTTMVTENGNVNEFSEEVFEDSPYHKAQSFVYVVNYLAEFFGVTGSKHDPFRFWCGFLGQDGIPTYVEE